MDISKKLRDVRENKGLSLEELAQKCAKDIDTVKGWEDGSIVPSASDLIGLSKVYEMTMDEMIYNDAEAPEYNSDNATYSNVDKKTATKTTNKRRGFTKGEKITLFIFPLLCVIVFLTLGITMNLWHPGWVIFAIIPIYYILIFILRNIGDEAEEAVDEYIEETK